MVERHWFNAFTREPRSLGLASAEPNSLRRYPAIWPKWETVRSPMASWRGCASPLVTPPFANLGNRPELRASRNGTPYFATDAAFTMNSRFDVRYSPPFGDTSTI